MKRSGFYERKNLLGEYERYYFWKDFKAKYPEYEDMSKSELRKVISGFFKYAGDLIVSSEHGIILNGLGYFSQAVFDVKKVVKLTEDETVFNFSNPNIYITYFFPRILQKNPLNSWSFKLYRPLKDRLKGLIKSGMKYKCHYDILRKNSQGRKYYIKDR